MADQPRPIAGGRLRALLTRLAVAEGRLVSTVELIDAVWPEDAPGGGANALQSLVSRLRRAVGDPDAIVQDAAGYRLAISRADLDTGRFADLVRAGQRRLAGAEHDPAVATLDEALALWRGQPLSDAGEAAYALGLRAGWESLRVRAEVDRLAALLGAGRFSDTVTEALALAAERPLDERVWATLLRGLAGAGRTSEALSAYETFRERLRDELGSDPGPELQALHLGLLRGQPIPVGPVTEVAPEPRPAPAPRRSNLRAALTSFVGRERRPRPGADRRRRAPPDHRGRPGRVGQDPARRRGRAPVAGRARPAGLAGRAGSGDRPGRSGSHPAGGARRPRRPGHRAHRAPRRRMPGSGCSTGCGTPPACW